MTLLDASIWNKKLFNGGWFESGQPYGVVEVATGEQLGQTGSASPTDVAQAAKEAQTAQRQWWALDYLERQAVFEKPYRLPQSIKMNWSIG